MEDQSLVEQYASTPQGQQNLAAAHLCGVVVALMQREKEKSGLSNTELADLLGVTEERVCEVLEGDGNIHIATFAKFMRAMKARPFILPLHFPGANNG